MAKTVFRRKIYDEMVEWKVNGNNYLPVYMIPFL